MLRRFLAFKEMQLSWDIHPWVTWMAFSSLTSPRWQWFRQYFLVRLNWILLGLPTSRIFQYSKEVSKGPWAFAFFDIVTIHFFFNIRPSERAMKTPQDGEKGAVTIRRRRNFGEDQQTERQLARWPLWCLLLKGFWKAEKLLSKKCNFLSGLWLASVPRYRVMYCQEWYGKQHATMMFTFWNTKRL